jgi:hypothetical protein
MNKYFSVNCGNSDDQLSKAVASYIFNLLTLGVKIPVTKAGVHSLEQLAQDAFELVLGDLVVCISVDESGLNIKVTLV